MKFKSLINWFLPNKLKNDPLHPEFDHIYTLISACVSAAVLLPLIYLVLLGFGYSINALAYNGLMCFCVLFLIRKGIIKMAMFLMGMITYVIYYPYIANSGGIYSPMIGFLYVYLVAAYWGHPKTGAYFTGLNILILYLLYLHTPTKIVLPIAAGGRLNTFIIHTAGMSILGALLWIVQKRQDGAREEIKQLQNQRIGFLDVEIAKRTEQLNNMRQVMATNFHDETGNMLSAITRQASLLKSTLKNHDQAWPMVESILKNSKDLHASSRDFLWNLNHNSDNPLELFAYLTSYGQHFFNQFDIAFSGTIKSNVQHYRLLDQFAALNLIFIFKEAMTNVVKHANAQEVTIEIYADKNSIMYALQDNGRWKAPENSEQHYGLSNMQKRCEKNNFAFRLSALANGTRIEITVPISTNFS